MGAGNVTARRRRLISLSGEQVLQLSGRDQEERDRDKDGGRERDVFAQWLMLIGLENHAAISDSPPHPF